jgi:hypothetical protein
MISLMDGRKLSSAEEVKEYVNYVSMPEYELDCRVGAVKQV